ncbi:hypothetical protein ACQQCD_05965 [Pseudarthrobacter sp. J1763]|uniref:aggregation-promoting factor C-terminal-like domain-containing protein n=1 Tax=Pseudarthrobacter sp. J1763 TaxID=3420445 RepID=UPI003D2CD40E
MSENFSSRREARESATGRSRRAHKHESSLKQSAKFLPKLIGYRTAVVSTAFVVLLSASAVSQAAVEPTTASALPGSGTASAAAGAVLSFEGSPVKGSSEGSQPAASASSASNLSAMSSSETASDSASADKAAAAKVAAAKVAAQKAAAAKAAAVKAAAAKAAAAKAAAAKAAAAVPVNDPAGAQAYAASQLSSHGWEQSEMQCLTTLWNKESDWTTTATNADSGAYGIAQSLPAEKMSTAGSDWQTNYKTQINWGLQYISERYGSPCSALT